MMPGSSSLLLFVSAALVLLAIPGPAVLYVTSRSIGLGRSAGLVSALGIGVGTLVHVAAAAVGLSALLMSSAAAFSAVKYLGASSEPEYSLVAHAAVRIRRNADFARSGHGIRGLRRQEVALQAHPARDSASSNAPAIILPQAWRRRACV